MMLMTNFKNKFAEELKGKKILDVGSQDINGSYRQMFLDLGCEYVGVDIVGGNGVDMIVPFNKLPFEDGYFDCVISGQTLEHAEMPWELSREMGRVLKSGGLSCWIAPWRFHVHRDALCPYDRWRILDDGMKILMGLAGLEVLDCQMYEDDTYGIGRKK